MNKINNFIIEKLKVSADTVIKNNFAQRQRDKYVSSKAQFKKFKKFWEDLKDVAGLKLAIVKVKGNMIDDPYIRMYKIREDEPDKLIWKYNCCYRVSTYKSFLHVLFDEECWDWKDQESFYNDLIICFDNIDENEIHSLEKLGFTEREFKYSNSDANLEADKKYITISTGELYDNIDKIYSFFFE